MSTKPFRYILFALLLLGMASCKDFIEPSIDKREVKLLAPGAHYQSKNYTITFWWDEVEDALTYRLQIVTPQFDTIGALIADTVVNKNQLALSLAPGQYQWRVRAENGSSQTAYSAAGSFEVLYSSIKQQSVQLSAPGNNALTNQSAVTFQWGNMFGATRYRLQVDTNSFADESKIIYNQPIAAQQYAFTFPKDQLYQWRVRAENDTAQSLWSSTRNIRSDHIPPAQVSLTSPGKGEVVALPVNLQWGAVTTASAYKLYVLKADSTSAYNASYPTIVSGLSSNFNLGNSGDRVYWKVSAVDAAGNEGQASVMRSFVIK